MCHSNPSARERAPRGVWPFLILGLALAGCNSAAENPPSAAVAAISSKPPVSKPPVALEGDRLANVVVPTNTTKQLEPSPFRFADIAAEAGVKFVQFSGMTDETKHFPTANGSGVAIFDYDGDGNLDLYFATGTLLPVGTALKGPNRLYKNMGNGTYEDRTEESGLGFRGFCHGIIVGDIDNDGDQDVFLCNYGSNVLYLNNGNGTFKDISKSAGIDKPNWSSSGAFLDYDNDGDLDLYVSNYGIWELPTDDQFCGDKVKHIRLYCSPRTIRTTQHLLYRNNGDLTFTDVYDKVFTRIDPDTKLRKPSPRSDGHGFGVVTADLNGDGLIDIYVANDMNPNFLFLNLGDGTFDDVSETSGAAFDERGQTQSGMGVDAEDINGDGKPDLFVTNFQNEYNTLYENFGKGQFMDSTAFLGLAADSLPWVGWGCALADFDNDGWPDAFVANGHVDNNRRLLNQPIDYEEIPLLHRNVALENGAIGKKGNGPVASRRFRLSTRDVGPYFSSKHVARGAAFGDIDNDGDIDIVINHKDGQAAVLRNDTPTENHWIRLHLVGTKSNRDAIGTRIEAEVDTDTGPLTIYRQRKGGCSLESANDPRVLIGIGPAKEVGKLTLRWPSGIVMTLQHLAADKTYEVVEKNEN
jgi:enediyne biosynthesis protein E4